MKKTSGRVDGRVMSVCVREGRRYSLKMSNKFDSKLRDKGSSECKGDF